MKLARFQRPELSWGETFNHLWNLRDEIDRFFEAPVDGRKGFDAFNSWAPAIDLYEENDNLIVISELPGLKKEDIEISLHNDTLTISGERKHEKKVESGKTSREERFFGRFQRSFALPKAVDASHVKASYNDGILQITLPKAAEAKPRQIKVQS